MVVVLVLWCCVVVNELTLANNKVAEGRALLRTWMQAPKERIALRGHNRPVTYLQMRGNKLMSCDDSVMRQWELASGKAIVSFATDAKNKCYHFQFDDVSLFIFIFIYFYLFIEIIFF